MSFRFRCRIWLVPRFPLWASLRVCGRDRRRLTGVWLSATCLWIGGGITGGRAVVADPPVGWGRRAVVAYRFCQLLGHGSRARCCRDADVGPRLLAKYLFFQVPSSRSLARFGTSQYEHAAAAGQVPRPRNPWPRTGQQRDPTERSRSPPALSYCTSISQPGTPQYPLSPRGCYRDPVTFPCA